MQPTSNLQESESPPRVLYWDNDDTDRSLLCQALRNRGAEVTDVSSVDEFQKTRQGSGPWDLIVLDLLDAAQEHQEIDSWEEAAGFRLAMSTREDDATVPIAFITSFEDISKPSEELISRPCSFDTKNDNTAWLARRLLSIAEDNRKIAFLGKKVEVLEGQIQSLRLKDDQLEEQATKRRKAAGAVLFLAYMILLVSSFGTGSPLNLANWVEALISIGILSVAGALGATALEIWKSGSRHASELVLLGSVVGLTLGMSYLLPIVGLEEETSLSGVSLVFGSLVAFFFGAALDDTVAKIQARGGQS